VAGRDGTHGTYGTNGTYPTGREAMGPIRPMGPIYTTVQPALAAFGLFAKRSSPLRPVIRSRPFTRRRRA